MSDDFQLHGFKWVVGLIPLMASVFIMALLFFIPVPAGNKDTLLPLAGVFFGWGGSVVSYEFGSSPSRKLNPPANGNS